MLSIVICDDDVQYLEILEFRIKQCIGQITNDVNVSCYSNLEDLKRHCEKKSVDILFLDIMINNVNAIPWSVENISKQTQIVFMTSYPTEAFCLSDSSFCYFVVKSRFSDEVLKKAVVKSLEQLAKRAQDLTIIKSGNKNYAINFLDIIYIETYNNSINIHFINKETLTVYTTMKGFLKNLPQSFLRCHKCYTVNMKYITCFEPHQFVMISRSVIPIPSKRYVKCVETFKNYVNNL